MTPDELLKEQRKAPAFKCEYDALEDRYQEEPARQEALDRAEEHQHRASAPPTTPRTAYA